MQKIIAGVDDYNVRLDKLLTTNLPNISRSQLQKLVKHGLILVNSKKVTPHHFLRTADVIDILADTKAMEVKKEEDKKALKTKKTIAPKKVKKTDLPEIEILFEDPNIVVINKPSGLIVHGTEDPKTQQEVTLIDWLLANYPKNKTVGDEPAIRPGIVHRLDKETSGVMVIAKTKKAFESLKEQFKNREIKKEYLAWIYGKLANDTGTINFTIGRSKESGKMAARPMTDTFTEAEEGQEGRESITDYEVIESHPHRSLIKAMPRTGRTHQIRVHFFAMAHPIIGDNLYKIKNQKDIATPRLLLHAHKLTFKDLKGVEKSFTAEIPKEFNF